MRSWVGLGLSVLIACAGKAPPNGNTTPDAPSDEGGPDGGISPTAAALSGKTIDYFGNVNLKGTDLATDGIDPQVTASSSTTDATYTLSIPVGSKLYVIASRTTGYRPTRNTPVAVADMPVTLDVYATSTPDVTRQYTTLGKTPTAGTAVVFAELRKTDGTPLEGIPLTGVQLLDAANQPVPGIVGPYFFGTAGDIDPALATATAYGTPPRSRVALLDVPIGTYTLAVTYAGTAGNITNNTAITTAADGTVLALSGGVPAPVSGATDPHFAQDIWPRLQRAADGGLGCANCHTAGGPAAVLPYDAPADTVLTNMRAATGVINTTTPAMSLFLVNPLYQPPPATHVHPNATFLDTNDPDYKLFLLWITNGTKP
jgi:hypothetical protein